MNTRYMGKRPAARSNDEPKDKQPKTLEKSPTDLQKKRKLDKKVLEKWQATRAFNTQPTRRHRDQVPWAVPKVSSNRGRTKVVPISGQAALEAYRAKMASLKGEELHDTLARGIIEFQVLFEAEVTRWEKLVSRANNLERKLAKVEAWSSQHSGDSDTPEVIAKLRKAKLTDDDTVVYSDDEPVLSIVKGAQNSLGK